MVNFFGCLGFIISIVFFENGYYLVIAVDDFFVKFWDLRKFKNFKIL